MENDRHAPEPAGLYTLEQWNADGEFKAEPGQEIAADIYNEFMDRLPPKRLPRETARKMLREYRLPVHAGFLAGEPTTSSPEGELYRAFGMNDYGKGKHYFYLGLSRPERKLPDGFYYYMDCMNAFANGGLFPSAEFDGDADAIQTAANYEATLYKYEYKDGERISSAVIYQPRFM